MEILSDKKRAGRLAGDRPDLLDPAFA